MPSHILRFCAVVWLCGTFRIGCPADAAARAETAHVVTLPPRLVMTRGFQNLEIHAVARGGGVEISGRKSGPERRLLALALPAGALTDGARTIVLRANLNLPRSDSESPIAVRPIVLLRDDEGNAWYRLTGTALAPEEGGEEIALPLGRLRPAGFNRKCGAAPAPGEATVWIGVVVDGAGAFRLRMHDVRVLDRGWKPSRPAPLLTSRNLHWRLAHDRAVKATVTRPEGPDGKPLLLRLDFTFPGGRHMYVTPSAPVREIDLASYAGLRMRYRAVLPPGIPGVLLMLSESGGGQFFAVPAPPASKEWREVFVPFSAFRWGTWSKDANQRLDLERVGSIVVGAHGTAAGKGGSGWIEVATIEAVPAPD